MVGKQSPHIAIITPTYNRSDLLVFAIDSILSQTGQNTFTWEMIVVDDGSTDTTRDVVQPYLAKEPRLTYIYQQNAGVGKARNTALDVMSADVDYVILLDSDDELMPDCLEKCLEYFDNLTIANYNKTLGVYYLCQDETGEVLGKNTIVPEGSSRHFTYDMFLRGAITVEMGIVVKAEIFRTPLMLRFPEDVTTETVMWAKMWQYMEQHDMVIDVWDYVGRLYRRFHTSHQPITKTISPIRCLKNAQGNEQVLAIIGADLLKRGLIESYADYHFRIGINYVLAGHKKLGLTYLKKSISLKGTLITLVVYVVALCSTSLLWKVYSRYITKN